MSVFEATVWHSPTDEHDRYLPEGPRAMTLEGREAVGWVNIQRSGDARVGDIHVRFWDTGEHRTYPQAVRPGFQFPTNRPGTLLIGGDKQVGLLDLATNQFTSWGTIPDPHPRTMINDGEIIPGGRAIVFGTKDFRFEDTIAELYLMTLDDRQITRLADGQLCSNGKVFARDGEQLLLYDIDTPKRNVVRYTLDVAARTIDSGTVVLDLSNCDGFPDGMCDSGDGSVIVAFYNPSAAHAGKAIRFDLATGQHLDEWHIPASPRVTCPLLVEQGGRVRLIVTTATEGMPSEMRRPCPEAGSLFVADTGLRRVPEAGFVRLGG